ncbi:hypothetical protein [Cyanobium sp. Morenito 9A2]|nr:hypothetical protein [Cyanobium sp. Morenito 9A2]MCP9850791.1 hypothetical protein [Cyanobium sp. Morenito 9A2]
MTLAARRGLRQMGPEATFPVLPPSLDQGRAPSQHGELGRSLASLCQ